MYPYINLKRDTYIYIYLIKHKLHTNKMKYGLKNNTHIDSGYAMVGAHQL